MIDTILFYLFKFISFVQLYYYIIKNNVLPISRNIVIKKNNNYYNIYDITFLYHFIYLLNLLHLNYFSRFLEMEICKTKIDFYIDGNYHSIVFVKYMNISMLINHFNDYINIYKLHKYTIKYNYYCSSICDFVIKSDDIILSKYNIEFIKKIIKQFRGVDSKYSTFVNNNFNISYDLETILELYGNIKQINYVYTMKIPNIKYEFNKSIDLKYIE